MAIDIDALTRMAFEIEELIQKGQLTYNGPAGGIWTLPDRLQNILHAPAKPDATLNVAIQDIHAAQLQDAKGRAIIHKLQAQGIEIVNTLGDLVVGLVRDFSKDQNEAHVICCNDSTEAVFIGSAEGAEELKLLLKDQFKQQQFNNGVRGHELECYMDRLFWRVRTVPLHLEVPSEEASETQDR